MLQESLGNSFIIASSNLGVCCSTRVQLAIMIRWSSNDLGLGRIASGKTEFALQESGYDGSSVSRFDSLENWVF